MKIQLAALVGVMSLVLLAPGGADASTHVQYGVQDDAWLLYGPEAPAKRIEILQRLGVDMVRLTLRWDAVAQTVPTDPRNPKDPAYHWDLYDPILQRLHAAHIGVLISLWGTPPWANEGQKPNFMPNDTTSLASFAYAASSKYPWITRWTIWNEPNVRLFLIPNSPSLYVSRLLNPAYRALKSANPRNLVAGGVTSPRKTPTGVSPIAWIRGMRAARALLDAYAQNPYPVRPGETPTSGGCWRCTEITMATLPKLITEVKARFGTRTRIWLTEYGYNSRPPSKWLGVSNTLQARYVSEAALRVYLASHVDLLINFLVRDEPDATKWTSGFLHESWQGEAVLRGVRASVCTGVAAWRAHERVGPGSAAIGPPALPVAAIPRRPLAVGRRNTVDVKRRLPAARDLRRARNAAAHLVAARSPLQRHTQDHLGRTSSATAEDRVSRPACPPACADPSTPPGNDRGSRLG